MWTKKIALLIVMFVLAVFTSYSQNIEVHSSSQNIGNAKLDLTGDVLIENNIEAFEQRAIQKIKDFNNYLEIIVDQNYDASLREHALTLALKLFENDSILINDKILFKDKKAYSINKWLEKLKKAEIESLKTTISNIEIKQKFTIQKNGTYKGTISYHVDYSCKDKKSKTIEPRDVQVEVTLKKTEELIGNNYIKAWKVFLGEIK